MGKHIVDHLLFESMLLEDVIPFYREQVSRGWKQRKERNGRAFHGVNADIHDSYAPIRRCSRRLGSSAGSFGTGSAEANST